MKLLDYAMELIQAVKDEDTQEVLYNINGIAELVEEKDKQLAVKDMKIANLEKKLERFEKEKEVDTGVVYTILSYDDLLDMEGETVYVTYGYAEYKRPHTVSVNEDGEVTLTDDRDWYYCLTSDTTLEREELTIYAKEED
ncbi:hypothetical protein vBCtySFA67_00047 [Clostridium phage vB_CtyS-FA67]|nr:hypothetical protein vBCtySFA67_00047 [Clostridium phage vB_CtyS-FA67]